MSIRREIEVTRKGLPRPIDVTFGTNMLPLEFVITDFELPKGAKLEAYAIGVSKNLVKQSCELSGNVISFTPEIGLFEEGKNVLQLAASCDGKDLFTFYMPVNCQKTMFYEGAQNLEEDPTFLGMVMQMKQDVIKLSKQIVYVTPQKFGAKGDGVTDDTASIQECFDYASENDLSVQFEPKTYICYGLNLPSGVHIKGNGAILKKPNLSAEPYNMTVDEMKWARLMSVSHSGDIDSKMTVIENFEFNGNCWEMWNVEDGYSQEQASLLFASCPQANAGKLFIRIENCYFHDNVSDGIHICTNTNAIINNCRSLDCFRGGLTVTGGNTTVFVDGFDSRSEQTPDGIDLEQDSNGYNGSKEVTLSLKNIKIDTDLDISVNSSSKVTIDNLVMRKGGYTLRGGGSLTVRNSVLIKDIENYTAADDLSNIIYAMTTSKYLFENVVFDGNGCNVAGKDSACQLMFYTPSDLCCVFDKCTFENAQWGIGGSGTRHPAELHVLNCHFKTVNGYGGRTENTELGLPFVRLEGNVFEVTGIAIQNINSTVTVAQVIKMSNNHIETCETSLKLYKPTLIIDETWTNGLAVAYQTGYNASNYYGKRKTIVSADPNGTRGIEGANFEDIATDGTTYWKYSGSGTVWNVMSDYVTEEELNAKGYLTSVPSEYITETELNAKGYLTQHQDLSAYAKTSQIPTKVSQLSNDSEFLTTVPSEYVTETELTNKGYAIKSSAETWTFTLEDGSTVTKKVVLA